MKKKTDSIIMLQHTHTRNTETACGVFVNK